MKLSGKVRKEGLVVAHLGRPFQRPRRGPQRWGYKREPARRRPEGTFALDRSARGVLFALLAYVAWGLLSPGGQILLQAMGPFTLNALRTLLALPVLVLLLGPRTTRAAVHTLGRDVRVWVLGAGWLALTFVPYLWSLRYLPPTITTLTVYLAPFLIAAWQHYRLREPVSPWTVPASLATLAGAALAIAGHKGLLDAATLPLGLGLAAAGVVGWSAYTIHLKVLTRTLDANVLTLCALATSAVTFVAGAAWEGFHVEWDRDVVLLLALYVAVPTITSFWLYSLSLRFVSATTVAVLLGVELVSTAVFSWLLAAESFTWMKVAGLAVTILAMTAYLWDERRRLRSAASLAAPEEKGASHPNEKAAASAGRASASGKGPFRPRT